MPVFAGIQTPRMSSERLDARCSLVERRLFGTRPHRTSSVLPRLFGPEWNLENLGGRVPGTLLGPEGSSQRCLYLSDHLLTERAADVATRWPGAGTARFLRTA